VNKLILGFLVFSTSAFSQIHSPLENLYFQYHMDTAGKSSQVIVSESFDDLERFTDLNVNTRLLDPFFVIDADKPKTISLKAAAKVHYEALYNPIVSTYSINKYDIHQKGIGFCFGRAMFVNIYLGMANIARANIKKVFVVGPMDNGAWAWHVSTIVESRNKRGQEIWLAIDPIMDGVMDVGIPIAI